MDNEELIINNEEQEANIINSSLSIINYTQVLFSVSKRNFKHAVDRNLIRRRMKEAYRLNKSLRINNFPPYIAFIYVAKEVVSYQNIEKSMKYLLKKLNR